MLSPYYIAIWTLCHGSMYTLYTVLFWFKQCTKCTKSTCSRFWIKKCTNCTQCTSCVHIVHDCKSKFLNFGLCYVPFRLSTMHFHRFSGFYFCFSLKSKSKTDINIELHRIINDYFEFHSRIVESISESKYSTLLRKSYQILCYGNLSRFLSPRFLSQATCALNWFYQWTGFVISWISSRFRLHNDLGLDSPDNHQLIRESRTHGAHRFQHNVWFLMETWTKTEILFEFSGSPRNFINFIRSIKQGIIIWPKEDVHMILLQINIWCYWICGKWFFCSFRAIWLTTMSES